MASFVFSYIYFIYVLRFASPANSSECATDCLVTHSLRVLNKPV